MAKATGIVKLKGTVDGLNFYMRKGVPVVRKAGGGYTSHAVKTSPRMDRVRENGSEWKRCMESVKYFKQGLNPFFHYVKDGDSHQRLVGLFAKIKDTDPISSRGDRNVGGGMQTGAGRQLLRGYPFHSGAAIGRLLRSQFAFSWEAGFSITDLSKEAIAFPAGATQLELTALFYVFDFDHNSWGLESKTVFIDKDAVPEGDLILAPAVLPEGTGIRTGLVMWRFMQEMNGAMYVLKEQGARGLEMVWIEDL